jgi:hypothetical protein
VCLANGDVQEIREADLCTMNNGWQDRSFGFESGGAEYLRRLKQDLESPPNSSREPVAVPAQEDASPGERRIHPRYKCEGSAEFRTPGSDVRTWGTLTDLSLSGCYIEMTATYPVGATVDLILELNQVRAEVIGEVRVSYPFLGIGVAFREVTPENKAQLEKMVRTLCPTPVRTREPEEPTGKPIPLPENLDASAALHALADFFAGQAVMTKEEFVRILGSRG